MDQKNKMMPGVMVEDSKIQNDYQVAIEGGDMLEEKNNPLSDILAPQMSMASTTFTITVADDKGIENAIEKEYTYMRPETVFNRYKEEDEISAEIASAMLSPDGLYNAGNYGSLSKFEENGGLFPLSGKKRKRVCCLFYLV